MTEKYKYIPADSPHISTTALENDFPLIQISQIAEQESWRKELNRPIYHIHKWWATRLGSIFRAMTLGALSTGSTDIWEEFYQLHDLAGKMVLDPFMGSGTTLGEAVKLGAKAVGCDINPISTFLVRQAFQNVEESELRAVFDRLKKAVAKEIQYYYQTKDPSTGQSIPVLYYFWVKTVTISDRETIPLFSKYVFSQNAYPRKKPSAQIICPHCWGVFEGRYDSTDIACIHCGYRFNPQNGPVTGQYVTSESGKRYRIKDLLPKDCSPPQHRLYALMALRNDNTKIYLSIRDKDLALYEEARSRLEHEKLPIPKAKVRPGNNTDQARGYNYFYWRDFFNARQLLCLGLLLREILKIEDVVIQEHMLCLFSSTLEFNNLFCSFKGEGTGAVRHMFSNHIIKPERTPLENSIWGVSRSSGTFDALFESRLVRAKQYLDEPFEIGFKQNPAGKRTPCKIVASSPISCPIYRDWPEFLSASSGAMILNGDSSKLPLPDKSVDAVITDPPYFDFIHYSELSDFFFAWLAPILKNRHEWFNRRDSSGKGEVQHKDPRIFSAQLTRVFAESVRVLKDEGILAFSFHHSRPEGWAAIYEAVNKAGLEVVSAHPVHAEMRSSSPKSASKNPISIDAILVCRKSEHRPRKAMLHNIDRIVSELAARLELGNFKLTTADLFVITASHLLIKHARDDLKYEEIKSILENVKKCC